MRCHPRTAGKFYYVGAVLGCTAEDAHEAALEADTAAARARSFEAQRRAGTPSATSAGTAAPMRSGALPASAAISTSLPSSRPGPPSSSSGWQQRSLSGIAASSWGGGAAGGGGSASAGRRYIMPSRKSLVYATRGRALHQLMPHGVTRQLAGNDEPLASAAAANSAAAAASANDSASDDPDSAVAMSSGGGGGGGRGAGRGVPQEEELRYGMGAGGGMDAGVNPCLMWPGACSFMPFTNIQAVAADPWFRRAWVRTG
ncbi:hypothetical protein CHLRE_17g731581v5 [Chlamydomonas reinhardtii]|uniref:Uncharacterized protein n=1 Tax=Chlamydomonas reinhardtii TaxID=3055 RepID=A0A2K3CR04_CHLRE|nr:uncharacterized protein CHLRE_17g731581v5 [Chlamydomonas reinhardtii]PNW70713.1 hypothetical protein CHLRE_17g731581v5 [Chlamydomonas reinhardtii]